MSLTQGLQRSLQQRPDGIATISAARRQTFAQYADRVARLAQGLRRMGVGRGDRIAILAQNSDRYAESFLAAWWTGAVVNPVNTRWSRAEIAYSLNDSGASILIADDAFITRASGMPEIASALRAVIHFGDASAPEGVVDYETLLAQSEPAEDVRCRAEELAVICYTGGTTGAPKGVMLSHGNLWSSAIARLAEAPVGADGCALQVAPLFHVAGLASLVTQTIVGATNVFVPAFDPPALMECIATHGVTQAVLVPTMIRMLLDHPSFGSYRLDSLKRIIYGASPISEALLDRALEALPGVDFIQSYGMTEAAPVVAMNPAENHRPEGQLRGKLRAAGKAALSVEIRIVDTDGNEVPRGTVGEVTVRGPNIMQGYWNKPRETAEALRDGWLHTGDGAYMDQDGYLYIVDRMKDMIISGGENVYSSEVENALSRHPAVAACAVIGIPSAEWGESVHAVIVPRAGMEASAEDIRLHCRGLIAGYKCPKSVEFRSELPLSAAGKVLKTVLREPHWQGRQRTVG